MREVRGSIYRLLFTRKTGPEFWGLGEEFGNFSGGLAGWVFGVLRLSWWSGVAAFNAKTRRRGDAEGELRREDS